MCSKKLNQEIYLSNLISNKDTEDILDIETIEFMSETLATFINEAIDKFIKGQKEHGGNIKDRDLNKEINNEVIDLFWYLSAKNHEK